MNAKPKKCAASDCGNRSSPTSPGGFCSFHATKEGSGFPGSKKITKSPRGTAAATTATTTTKKAGGEGGIFDRLTDTKNYTGVYAERFDADGKGKGINLTTSHTNQNDLSDLADRTASDVRGLKISEGGEEKKSNAAAKPKRCAASDCSNKSSPTSPGGFCSFHATKEGSGFPGSKKITKSPRGTAAATAATTTTKKKAGGEGGIFDRLTDTKNYTGVYAERFDEDGKGKGINLTTSHQGGTQLNDLLDRTPADVRGRKA